MKIFLENVWKTHENTSTLEGPPCSNNCTSSKNLKLLGPVHGNSWCVPRLLHRAQKITLHQFALNAFQDKSVTIGNNPADQRLAVEARTCHRARNSSRFSSQRRQFYAISHTHKLWREAGKPQTPRTVICSLQSWFLKGDRRMWF